MNRKQKLENAIKEANVFLKRAKEALEEINGYEIVKEQRRPIYYSVSSSRKYAATKRSSMELSTALIEIRKP
jgi:uncharacterized protein with NRDE domain